MSCAKCWKYGLGAYPTVRRAQRTTQSLHSPARKKQPTVSRGISFRWVTIAFVFWQLGHRLPPEISEIFKRTKIIMEISKTPQQTCGKPSFPARHALQRPGEVVNGLHPPLLCLKKIFPAMQATHRNGKRNACSREHANRPEKKTWHRRRRNCY